MFYQSIQHHTEEYFSDGDSTYIKIDFNLLKQILDSKGTEETIKECLKRLLNPTPTEKPVRHLDLDD